MGESAVWSSSGLRVIPAVVVAMGLRMVVVATALVVVRFGVVVVTPSVVVVMPTAVSVGERRTAYG